MNVNVIGYAFKRLQAELARAGSWVRGVQERAISGVSPLQLTVRTCTSNPRKPILAGRGFVSGKGLSMLKVTAPSTVHVNSGNARL